MKRIRLVFLGLAALLLLTVGLLVKSAFDSARAERRVRQMALAERILDEMERELWSFVRQEESRPVGHYRFYYVPERASAAGPPGLVISPLAGPPEHDWVLGYFQIGPGGEFSTPRLPQDPEEARARGDWDGSATVVDQAAAFEAQVMARLRDPGLAAPPLGAPPAFEPGPKATPPASEALAAAGEEDAGLGDYRALQELNRGMKPRPRRMLRLHVSKAEDGESLEVIARVEQPDGRTEEVARARVPLPRAARPALEAADADAGTRALPFSGTLLADRQLLLTRAVVSGERGLRQGMLIDLDGLAAWLESRVLGDGTLAHHTRRQFFPVVEGPPAEPAEAFAYVHRFAEPFDGLGLRLSIDALRQGRGSLYLAAISGLLVLAGAAGLFALYRMVSVTVRFAERRSNFAAAVSHELKTPLTSIRLYAEMLRDGMVTSEDTRREYCATITEESERLSRLIDNVLEFSKLEQGKRDVHLTAGAIGPVVAEAARRLEPHARAAGFRLEVEIAEGLPAVRFDRDAVTQVVFNLVDNALKYARDAGDRVVVLRCQAREGGVALAVRDRGPGVASRHLPRIFEAFYRGQDELTRTAKGTGIGLALVKGLAERMGAVVSGRNAEEGGFEVSLLFRPAAAK